MEFFFFDHHGSSQPKFYRVHTFQGAEFISLSLLVTEHNNTSESIGL